jgi:methylated-DNA-[protein]-cysteine S-methyltransferase
MKLAAITKATPDGAFHIILDEDDVARASGFGLIGDLIRRLPVSLRATSVTQVKRHPYQKLVEAYYDGDKTALSKIPRTQDGSEFQRQVWKAISYIPYGETISYKALAEASGNVGAIRAAGTTCGINRLILLIPCHRVVKSNGDIGSYLYGSVIKESLLRHERVIK